MEAVKLIILYAGLEAVEQAWPDKQSLALQNLAGSNVLGHVLNQLRDTRAAELIVVADSDAAAIAAWLAQQMPALKAEVVQAAPGATSLHALAALRDSLDGQSLLIALGSAIVEAQYEDLAQSKDHVTFYTRPQQLAARGQETAQDGSDWAGIAYFRSGADLRAALDDAPRGAMSSLGAFLSHLQDSSLTVAGRPATLALDARTIDGLLFANARLLGLGYGSEDAIERSYVEDFTVIPPVFLHETAVIENAVIGPFTNVEAGARISGSIVRNTLLGQESAVKNVVLDASIIGRRATVTSSGSTLLVGEDQDIAL